jgi:GIY-YIG domain-containing protein
MGRWTELRKIADRNCWYGNILDYEGPACYELAIAGPRGGSPQIVYVGETVNERSRLSSYARHGSHLAGVIDFHLACGYSLLYRAQALNSKAVAKRMQDGLLARFHYPWNTLGVG